MTVLLVLKEDVVRLICGYAPQSGRCFEGKQYFYDELSELLYADGLVLMSETVKGLWNKFI